MATTAEGIRFRPNFFLPPKMVPCQMMTSTLGKNHGLFPEDTRNIVRVWEWQMSHLISIGIDYIGIFNG